MKRGENREILLERTTISESQPKKGKAKASQKHSRNAQRTALSYTVRKRNGSKRSKDIQIKNQLKKGKHESNRKKREEAESEIKQSKESQKATQSNVKQR